MIGTVALLIASAMILGSAAHMIAVARKSPELQSQYGLDAIVPGELIWAALILALIWGARIYG